MKAAAEERVGLQIGAVGLQIGAGEIYRKTSQTTDNDLDGKRNKEMTELRYEMETAKHRGGMSKYRRQTTK